MVNITSGARFGDDPLEPGDLLTISGSSAADGDYTVEAVVSDTEFQVVETIPDSTGGTVDFIHPEGASRVGIDNVNMPEVTGSTLNLALRQMSTTLVMTDDVNGDAIVEDDTGNFMFEGNGE
jgi:hypothetical protein